MVQVAQKHTMSVINKSGDVKVTWDPAVPAEVDIAREAFNAHKKKGHAMFRVKGLGGQGEKMTEFDPQAERILVVPPVAGGR